MQQMRDNDRLRRCISMAMACLDPLSSNPDERLAWYRLLDALDGKEARSIAVALPETNKTL